MKQLRISTNHVDGIDPAVSNCSTRKWQTNGVRRKVGNENMLFVFNHDVRLMYMRCECRDVVTTVRLTSDEELGF